MKRLLPSWNLIAIIILSRVLPHVSGVCDAVAQVVPGSQNIGSASGMSSGGVQGRVDRWVPYVPLLIATFHRC